MSKRYSVCASGGSDAAQLTDGFVANKEGPARVEAMPAVRKSLEVRKASF